MVLVQALTLRTKYLNCKRGDIYRAQVSQVNHAIHFTKTSIYTQHKYNTNHIYNLNKTRIQIRC